MGVELNLHVHLSGLVLELEDAQGADVKGGGVLGVLVAVYEVIQGVAGVSLLWISSVELSKRVV
jgi:hypothetical protein